MVALQIIALNGLGARDAVEVLQQEFCHGNAFGKDTEQVAAVGDSVSQEICIGIDGASHESVNVGVELLPGFEEVGKAFRSCEGALHRCHCNTVSSF